MGPRFPPQLLTEPIARRFARASGAEPVPCKDTTLEDRARVTRALAGERQAKAELYNAHAHALLGLSVRLLGRTGEAEDVLHDSFVTAFERLDQLRDASSFRAWMARIVVHEVHRRFRRRRLLRTLGFDLAGYDAGLAQLAAPGLPADAHAELATIDRVLAELPAGQRLAWMLRHVEGHELTDVAAQCGTSLATIKRWLAAAQARIDAMLRGSR
jgi:RNA polymerase sigma-70 factor (ECF subfamily)